MNKVILILILSMLRISLSSDCGPEGLYKPSRFDRNVVENCELKYPADEKAIDDCILKACLQGRDRAYCCRKLRIQDVPSQV